MESRSCRKALFVFKDNSFVFKDKYIFLSLKTIYLSLKTIHLSLKTIHLNELSLKTNSAFLQEWRSIQLPDLQLAPCTCTRCVGERGGEKTSTGTAA